MPIQHVIKPGESTIGLSEQHGFFAATIWEHPDNAALKEQRKDMNILLPGDVLVIPDKREKSVSKPGEKRHRFRRKGVPAQFRLQLFDIEKPRANQDYQLDVDGRLIKGKTDGDGVLLEFVPPGAREGLLTIGPDRFELIIQFSQLDPVGEVIGVQKRLNNLGFHCGEPDGELNEATEDALADFQERFGLEVTGEIDDSTREKLDELHTKSRKLPPDERKE